jgi:S-formylglutathione hydrolase
MSAAAKAIVLFILGRFERTGFSMICIRVFRAIPFSVGILALSLLGCRTNQLPLPDHPRLAPGVAMQDVTFHSKALNREMPYRVFLPAHPAPGQKLPVVYLLHGGNGGFRDWSNYSDVASYAAPKEVSKGLILVMPEGVFSYYQNASLKPEDRYEDYIVHDLIADVESRFPAAQGREHRAIIGISMGGFAAIKLALAQPHLFVFVGAFSPSIDVLRRRSSIKRIGEWWRIRSIFGPEGSEARQKADPFVLARSADPAKMPYLYLTAGEQEPLLDPNRRFAALLSQRHFDHEFHTKPGGHDWTEWDAQIPGCFESLMQRLPALETTPQSQR